jgi:hypothetical protein
MCSRLHHPVTAERAPKGAQVDGHVLAVHARRSAFVALYDDVVNLDVYLAGALDIGELVGPSDAWRA